jgi:hypothetical protein
VIRLFHSCALATIEGDNRIHGRSAVDHKLDLGMPAEKNLRLLCMQRPLLILCGLFCVYIWHVRSFVRSSFLRRKCNGKRERKKPPIFRVIHEQEGVAFKVHTRILKLHCVKLHSEIAPCSANPTILHRLLMQPWRDQFIYRWIPNGLCHIMTKQYRPQERQPLISAKPVGEACRHPLSVF